MNLNCYLTNMWVHRSRQIVLVNSGMSTPRINGKNFAQCIDFRVQTLYSRVGAWYNYLIVIDPARSLDAAPDITEISKPVRESRTRSAFIYAFLFEHTRNMLVFDPSMFSSTVLLFQYNPTPSCSLHWFSHLSYLYFWVVFFVFHSLTSAQRSAQKINFSCFCHFPRTLLAYVQML